MVNNDAQLSNREVRSSGITSARADALKKLDMCCSMVNAHVQTARTPGGHVLSTDSGNSWLIRRNEMSNNDTTDSPALVQFSRKEHTTRALVGCGWAGTTTVQRSTECRNRCTCLLYIYVPNAHQHVHVWLVRSVHGVDRP